MRTLSKFTLLILAGVLTQSTAVSQTSKTLSFELVETPLSDATALLQQRYSELSGGKFVNIILNLGGLEEEPTVTMKLSNVTFKNALDYMAWMAGAEVRYESDAVVVSPAKKEGFPGPQKNQPTKSTLEKLNTLMIPNFESVEAPVDDVIEFLHTRSIELDTRSSGSPGINIVRFQVGDAGEVPTVTLKLRDVPLGTALRYVCELTDHEARVHERTVFLLPKQAPENEE